MKAWSELFPSASTVPLDIDQRSVCMRDSIQVTIGFGTHPGGALLSSSLTPVTSWCRRWKLTSWQSAQGDSKIYIVFIEGDRPADAHPYIALGFLTSSIKEVNLPESF
ncbi:hypothetical protein PTTG_26406 [Puccinia triticina 1-1 BBBD Race 1]|uniref:Uncharacterized protein n=2 Tax=Puccinia triticina TaxID=208348 RepID=A0A180GUH3_PUCT1|nr:uncharacterized protein PtA15_7A683 [Puccinia triticina]OAV96174.1 hypothetical protein PTTG_26406 [Puccinia triticina 1-1 BBBD Race 1]WAQ86954.1 hypothetical protein PtA15_7A683 [Puccinia triticina]WAR56816.1 hypothetical protein PtB15_7B667 [Puccinia triticina]